MAKNSAFGKRIAARAFSFQKKFGSLSPQTMASARRIMEGSGGSSDVETVASALGITHSGSKKAKREERTWSSIRSTIGSIGGNINSIRQGGAVGVAGAIGLGDDIAHIFDKIGKSKDFQDALQTFIEKGLLNPNSSVSRTITKGLQSFAGGKGVAAGPALGYKLARIGKKIEYGIDVLAVAKEGMDVGFGIGDLFRGVSGKGNESARLARSESELTLADPYAPLQDKIIARKKAVAADIDARNQRNHPFGLPLGDYAAYSRKIKVGASEEEISKLESRAAIYRSGLGNVGNLREISRGRVLKNKYGVTLAEGMKRLPDYFTHTKAIEEETTAAVSASLDRAKKLRHQAFDFASRREFDASNVYFREADKELGLAHPRGIWENPAELYTAIISTTGAARIWSSYQHARAGPRTGE